MRALTLSGVIGTLGLFLAQAASAAAIPAAGLANPMDGAGVSARAVAMGSAFVAEAQGATALYWDPAGLSGVDHVELGLHHNSWLAGIVQETAIVGLPLGVLGGIGLGVNYVNYGTIPGYDESGTRLADYGADRYGLAAGWGAEIIGGLAVGGALRGMVQNVSDSNYSSLALDLGVQWLLWRDLRLALAYTGLGTKVADYSQVADMSLGFSYHLHLAKTNTLVIASSASFEPQGVNRVQVGVEDTINSMLALRAGYQAAQTETRIEGLNGLTLGIGVILDGLTLDYAFLPIGDLGNGHRISLGYKFGG